MATPEHDQRTDDEILVDVLLGLRMDRVRDFVRSFGFPTSGAKADLRERVREGVEQGAIPVNAMVDYLDQVEPWGRQHVILLEAEQSLAQGWRRADGIRRRLSEAGVDGLLARTRRLRLPRQLTLSSIQLRDDSITISAVERREYDERAPDLDLVDVTEEGQLIVLKAYRHVVTRGIVALRWNPASGAAALHVSEGHGRYDYADAAARFGVLISEFLDFDRFGAKDIRRAIRRLHDDEKQGRPEARSHRVAYVSHGGRAVEATSPTPSTSVVGEQIVDDAMLNVAGAATGRAGNFYWLPLRGPVPAENPLLRDLHVVVLARESRVHFMVPSNEEAVTYVLRRIRALS